MYSIVGKMNKGHRYYYLREQRREGDKVRPRDFYLGRMDSEAVPGAVVRMLKAKKRQPGWIRARFGCLVREVGDALGWWKVIDDARRWMAVRGKRTKGPRERRWIDSAPRKVAKLEAALQANRESKKQKALAFYRQK